MNLFQRYGIKEVADVTFYSIIEIGDEEIYIPVLYLDTLKISDINQASDKTSQKGGYGNQQILYWQHNKKFTLNLNDALFSPLSMNMTMGWINNIGSKYITLIKKIGVVNKYYKNNYSPKAYPSPQLTKEEWQLLLKVIEEKTNLQLIEREAFIKFEDEDRYYSAQNRYNIENLYYKRLIKYQYLKKTDGSNKRLGDNNNLISTDLILLIFKKINEVKDFNKIETSHYNIQVLDRMEKIYVNKDEGLNIDLNEQIQNLYRYYNNDTSCNYFIYYDEKTMQPLALFNKKWFKSLEADSDNDNVQIEYQDDFNLLDEEGRPIEDKFTLKKGTSCYKWSRTVEPVLNNDSFIGQSLIIDGNSFPGKYKIVGETYIREQNGIKDQRYQFVIPYATIPSDQKIELRADGGPSVFNMQVEVLAKDNKPSIELRQFNVDKDIVNGGTRVVPQSTEYNYTPIIVKEDSIEPIDNNEIYF